MKIPPPAGFRWQLDEARLRTSVRNTYGEDMDPWMEDIMVAALAGTEMSFYFRLVEFVIWEEQF